MIKRLMFLVSFFTLSACVPGQQAVDSKELEDLENHLEELQEENETLLEEVDTLKKQIRRLREKEIEYTSRITWQNHRINELEQAYKDAKDSLQSGNEYDPVFATFIGVPDEAGVEGTDWYRAETKYTRLYFHGEAVKMEYVVEDIDNMYRYILSFLGESWDGDKISIFFTDHEQLFGKELFSGYYQPLTGRIWISPEFTEVYDDEYGEFLFDPRETLLHELFHAVSKFNQRLPYEDYWFEEGMASYLALTYEYDVIDEQKFPEASEERVLYNVYWLEYADYSFPEAIHDEQELNEYWAPLSDEEKAEFFTLNGIGRLHYGDSYGITISFFEASIVDALITFYGEEKTLDYYLAMKHVQDTEEMERQFESVFQETIDEFEMRWKERILSADSLNEGDEQ
ncbi:hypothetical protein EDD68_11532 [Melghiribacillus thermohalophilus]|uniref:Uncharacterized protein n=1 Tax=Melghiribacillus thermohalophilus TaxID=1324956 RepID=A0A4V6NZX2_9BACI|nr:hypothetical protein [Melghiribacillus thermohalophilus]TCT19982.1 hypothetical protein EDD68_11532 [Melghiribacillus thermohalophilus]